MMNYDEILHSCRVPVRVSFEPTISCNLRCPMCDRTHKKDYGRHRDEKLSYERTLDFIREIGSSGVRYFLFIGGGEPLIDPHTTEYMEILKSYGVYVHLWTNGTLIDEKNAPLIAKYCDMVTVSLDSVDPAVNDVQRGVEGSAEKTIRGIRLLRENSDTLFLRIHSVISALNLYKLREIADFAALNRVTEIGGALVAPYPWIPEEMRFTEEETAQISNRIEDLSEYAKAKGVALAGCYANTSAKIIENLRNIHNMYADPEQFGKLGHISCLGFWSQATVRPNGDVTVCCFSYEPVLGNLHDGSFIEIWNSEQAERIRERVKKGELLVPPCKGCDTGNIVFTREFERTGSLDSFFEMCINAR